MSNQTPCHDCRIPVSRGQQVQRTFSLKLRVFCRPCAEDRGWIDPAPLANRFAAAVSAGVSEAELYANRALR